MWLLWLLSTWAPRLAVRIDESLAWKRFSELPDAEHEITRAGRLVASGWRARNRAVRRTMCIRSCVLWRHAARKAEGLGKKGGAWLPPSPPCPVPPRTCARPIPEQHTPAPASLGARSPFSRPSWRFR
jgi:hypothetical protein